MKGFHHEMTERVIKNWVTTLTGLGVIIVHVVVVHRTGVSIDPAIISAGLGLIAASDGV